ncbi:hypothetical protein [Pyrinomonas methylaliphatogenes]|uniref:Uncharacterized protein n=1 Tax=Pyrinomonas methylaliphatogenes TaxID=454194 RepID=A0A0B6WWY1_9BACT|nr:hypothetical protein [Pyrinomonas methylaliphatogenes]CDM65803.1 Domain of unknown function (DUF4412) [Pyrinomonas methylaliphatogenes]
MRLSNSTPCVKRYAVMISSLLLVSFVSFAKAQDQGAKGWPPEKRYVSVQTGPGPASGTFVFISSEMSFNKIVKGAPFAAEEVTESVQTLADGNRIARRSTATIYRDGEGRVRREQVLDMIGPFPAKVEPLHLIFISDPVAKVNYILDPRTNTARKHAFLELPKDLGPMSPPPHGEGKPGPDATPLPPPGPISTITAVGPSEKFGSEEVKSESLGKQVIEGVEAEGTRLTLTIPAGAIGNERPIEVVFERWYSPELQMVVMTRHSDPRFGETTYRLTNIKRGEPDRSLFEVPSNYTIEELPVPQREFRIKRRG